MPSHWGLGLQHMNFKGTQTVSPWHPVASCPVPYSPPSRLLLVPRPQWSFWNIIQILSLTLKTEAADQDLKGTDDLVPFCIIFVFCFSILPFTNQSGKISKTMCILFFLRPLVPAFLFNSSLHFSEFEVTYLCLFYLLSIFPDWCVS